MPRGVFELSETAEDSAENGRRLIVVEPSAVKPYAGLRPGPGSAGGDRRMGTDAAQRADHMDGLPTGNVQLQPL